MQKETPDSCTIAAFLLGREVGRFTIAGPQGDTALIINMSLDPAMIGRGYTDQMLGEIFSRARKQGCTNLQLMSGDYPENLIERYAFDSQTLRRSIDVHMDQWEEVIC